MLHRLREACNIEAVKMDGEVEIDEVYIGGKESSKHESKKLRRGRGAVGKQPVLGMRERNGKVTAKSIPNTRTKTIETEIEATVEDGATVYTDEFPSYCNLGKRYDHQTVNHSAKEYVYGMAHTNGIESVWAVMKRGFNGVYHNWSKKHMDRYVSEFTFRLNEGNVQHDTMERIDKLVDGAFDKRLTFDALTE